MGLRILTRKAPEFCLLGRKQVFEKPVLSAGQGLARVDGDLGKVHRGEESCCQI